jgi:hypothetical protein
MALLDSVRSRKDLALQASSERAVASADFTAGLKTQGVIVAGKTLNTTTSGSTFICSPATGPAPLTLVSLCGWDDGDTIGLVMNVTSQPVSATLRDAVAARGAGEH